MAQRIVIFIIVSTFLALAFGAENVSVGPQPPPDTTTTPRTTTPTTTTPTTTTPTTTTPTTTTPTTTTPTTTTPTTTTPTTTTPTTTTPSTTTTPQTTTPAPTTTPKPEPVPEPGTWTVTTPNVTCIIASMAIQINVSYPQSDNKTGYAIIDVPGNKTTASGECGNMTQTINLAWKGLGVKENHTLTLSFEKNTTTNHFHLDHIVVILNANVTEFPGISDFTKMDLHNDKSEFSTTVGMSYHCSKKQALNLTRGDGSNVTVATITVSNVKLEPFHKKNDAVFSAAEDCEHSNTPDIVPIAVGCALVGLVAIVLIAYLVGRRRSQARGYLSM